MWSVNLSDADGAPKWLPYPEPQNSLIEAAHARGAKSLALEGSRGQYRIDFLKGRQVRREDASRWREIRRQQPEEAATMPTAPAAAATASPAAKGAAIAAAPAAKATAAKKRRATDGDEADDAPADAHPAKKTHTPPAAAAASSSFAAAAAPARPAARAPCLSGLATVELLSVFAFLDSVSICLLGRVSRSAQDAFPRAWTHTLLRLDSLHPLAATDCPRVLTQREHPARVALRWRSPRLVPGWDEDDVDEPSASERIESLFSMPVLPFIVDLDASAAGEDLSSEDWERVLSHGVLAANLRTFRGFEGEDGDAPTTLFTTLADHAPNLTSLSLKPDSCEDPEDWMSLTRLPKLTRLATQDTQLTLAALDGCGQVRHLDLYGSGLDFRAFHSSQIASRLESLAWRWLHCNAPVAPSAPAAAPADGSAAPPQAKPPTAAEYLRAFSALHRLLTLELDQVFGVDAWARHLSRIPGLERLILRPDLPYAPQVDAEGKQKANDSAPSAAVLAKLMQACPLLEVSVVIHPRTLPGDTVNAVEIERAGKLLEELTNRYAGNAVLSAPRFRIRNEFPEKADPEAGADKDEEGTGEEEED